MSGYSDDLIHLNEIGDFILDQVNDLAADWQEGSPPTLQAMARMKEYDSWLSTISSVVEEMPVPDWSLAPDWAQWWALDDHKRAWWYENEPAADTSDWVSRGRAEFIAYKYRGWRKTLTQRGADRPGSP